MTSRGPPSAVDAMLSTIERNGWMEPSIVTKAGAEYDFLRSLAKTVKEWQCGEVVSSINQVKEVNVQRLISVAPSLYTVTEVAKSSHILEYDGAMEEIHSLLAARDRLDKLNNPHDGIKPRQK